MTNLIAFLNARLDEKRQYAEGLLTHGPRDVSGLVSLSNQMLREVEAVRAILERYERAGRVPESVVSFTAGQDDGYRQACLDAMRDFAAVYSDHPDYRDEWSS